MITHAEKLLAFLDGPALAIADTVRREVEAAAPYAEFGLSLGVPTWSLHGRVLSLIPFTRRCNLHFWDGAALDAEMPGLLRATSSGNIRFLELHSMLEVTDEVQALISRAFSLRVAALAAEDAAQSNADLLHS